jgi:hypothetical protein
VEPTQLGPNRVSGPETETSSFLFSSDYVPPEDGDKIQSPKQHALNKRLIISRIVIVLLTYLGIHM